MRLSWPEAERRPGCRRHLVDPPRRVPDEHRRVPRAGDAKRVVEGVDDGVRRGGEAWRQPVRVPGSFLLRA